VFNGTPGSATVPGRQIDVYGNILRFQLVWFWN
jgi:hypothetical protein